MLMMKAYFNKPKMPPRNLLKMPRAAMSTRPVKSLARKKMPTHTIKKVMKNEIHDNVCGFTCMIFNSDGWIKYAK